MRIIESKKNQELRTLVKNAADFHGHLGPFLVIGVRAGILARKILNSGTEENARLRVTARLPLSTPFSCILDGIQATTHCTIGNQKLRIKDSKTKITVLVEKQDGNRSLGMDINPKVVEELQNRFSRGASNKELAREIASIPESQLFTIIKQ